MENEIDAVLIGYNEPEFATYVSAINNRYGAESMVARDLKFNYFNYRGGHYRYIDLLDHVFENAGSGFKYPRKGSTGIDRLESGDMPSLAAVYLTNYLRKAGFRVEYIDLFRYQTERLRSLIRRRPRCIAITTTFYIINEPVKEMIRFIRSVDKEILLIVGGPLVANHVRNYAEDALELALGDMGADIYVVDSQGEWTLKNLIHSLATGRDWKQLPNLAFFEAGEFKRTTRLPENNDVSENLIDWSLFKAEELGPTLQSRTARSCAFSCSFCNYPTRAGALTLASLDSIKRELDSMKQMGTVKNVVFIDDTFNVPTRRFKDICNLLIREQYGFNWFSYFRSSHADDEAIELMAASGCRGVFLGIESGSTKLLQGMNKHADIEKYRSAISALKKKNIITFASLITGFPGETKESVRETIEFIDDAKPDYYRTLLWYNEPGTQIHAKAKEYNIEGEGFVWKHCTMDSGLAMDCIEEIFRSVRNSVWLPAWSFDFWIIPYLLGRGIDLNLFHELMGKFQCMLALEFREIPIPEKVIAQDALIRSCEQMIREHARSAWSAV